MEGIPVYKGLFRAIWGDARRALAHCASEHSLARPLPGNQTRARNQRLLGFAKRRIMRPAFQPSSREKRETSFLQIGHKRPGLTIGKCREFAIL